MSKERNYLALSYEYHGAYWKSGLYGYTYDPSKALLFTEEEIRQKQVSDPYSGWEILTNDTINKIPTKNQWAVDARSITFVLRVQDWCRDNIDGYAVFKEFEEKTGSI